MINLQTQQCSKISKYLFKAKTHKIDSIYNTYGNCNIKLYTELIIMY